jgi:hypothetical protein
MSLHVIYSRLLTQNDYSFCVRMCVFHLDELVAVQGVVDWEDGVVERAEVEKRIGEASP